MMFLMSLGLDACYIGWVVKCSSGKVQENRRHRRLKKKAASLEVKDLLEIAAMKAVDKSEMDIAAGLVVQKAPLCSGSGSASSGSGCAGSASSAPSSAAGTPVSVHPVERTASETGAALEEEAVLEDGMRPPDLEE